MAQDDSLKGALFLIGGGSYYYYKSFIKHKLRRRMSDIPRSKIGTAAIGSNVEVEGKILNMADDGISSPLSGDRGAAFIWRLERLVKRGKNSSWKHLYTFYSTPYLYIHDDEEHTAAIDLSSCEFQENIFHNCVNFDDSSFDLPEKVKNILTKSSMLDTNDKTSFFTTSKFRLQEKVFSYGQPIYVLGTAISCPNREIPMNPERSAKFGSREIGYKRKILDLFKRTKSDRNKMSHYDTNKNLVLDKSEEAALMKDIEAEILADHGKTSINEFVKNAKLLFTIDESASGPFKLDKVYLSTKSEAHLSGKLRIEGFLGLVGGPIMIAIGVYILVTQYF
jgi:hypothetical protein